MRNISRREAAMILAASALSLHPLSSVRAQGTVTLDMIVNDPDAPNGGNPKGDVTIVAFLDYNCPFCKKSSLELERIVKEDGKIRVVYRDWPVLAPTSYYGSQLALAAKYQGRYEAVHRALMAIPGTGVPKDRMLRGVRESGVDMKRLESDVATHAADIEALVKRTLAIGDALGFEGTPVYLVGPYKASTLDLDGFREAVAAARERKSK